MVNWIARFGISVLVRLLTLLAGCTLESFALEFPNPTKDPVVTVPIPVLSSYPPRLQGYVQVPEPSLLILLGVGLGAIGLILWRRRK